jgi:hypothetical protein
MTTASDAARRIHAEALELQRRFAEAPPQPSAPQRRPHPLMHATALVLVISLASAALLLLLAAPALS